MWCEKIKQESENSYSFYMRVRVRVRARARGNQVALVHGGLRNVHLSIKWQDHSDSEVFSEENG